MRFKKKFIVIFIDAKAPLKKGHNILLLYILYLHPDASGYKSRPKTAVKLHEPIETILDTIGALQLA